MSAWTHEALEILKRLAGAPENALSWTVFGAAIALSGLILLKLMGLATGDARSTWLWNVAALIVCSALLLVAATAGRLYLLPIVNGRLAPHWVDVASAVAGLLLLAAPAFCLLHRVRYSTAFMTLLVTGVGAALAAMLAMSLHAGSDVRAIRERTERIQRELEP